MNNMDLNLLATYNAEVARGIMHTEAWQIKMMELKVAFQKEWDNMRTALRIAGVPHE